MASSIALVPLGSTEALRDLLAVCDGCDCDQVVLVLLLSARFSCVSTLSKLSALCLAL
jgi:hypothetical protein